MSSTRQLLDSLTTHHIAAQDPGWRELGEELLTHTNVHAISFYSTTLGSEEGDEKIRLAQESGDPDPRNELPLHSVSYDIVEVPEGARVVYKGKELTNPPRLIPLFKLPPRSVRVITDQPFKVYKLTTTYRERWLGELQKVYVDDDSVYTNGELFVKA
jgi:hypothetical protein